MKGFFVKTLSLILKLIFAVYSIPFIVSVILFVCAFGILIYPLYLLFCVIDWLSNLD